MNEADLSEKPRPGTERARTQLREIARQWTVGGVMLRILLFGVLWAILAEGQFRYWFLIALTILVATALSLILVPTVGLKWSPGGVVRFGLFFVYRSILGGLDVAARALSRRPRIDPEYMKCRLRLELEPARVLVANTMSLMPGTLSVSLENETLRVHVLDSNLPVVERIREVEDRVARMFRLELDSEDAAVRKQSGADC